MPFNGSKFKFLNEFHLWREAYDNVVGDSNAEVGNRSLPRYVPGLQLFPNPKAGVLGHIDVAFWAAFLYPLASVFYVLSCPYVIFPDEDDKPVNSNKASTICNLIAAVLLLIDALFCFLDWHIMRNAGFSSGNTTVEVTEGNITLKIEGVSSTHDRNYFLNNLFFLAAAVIFLIQGMWMENYHTDLYNCNPDLWCGTFHMNFWGSVGYLVSSLFCL